MYDGLPNVDGSTETQESDGYEGIARTESGEIELLVGVAHDGVAPETVAARLERLAANLPDGITPVTENGDLSGDTRIGTLRVRVDPDVISPERAYKRLNSDEFAAVEYAEGNAIYTPAGISRREMLAAAGAGAGGLLTGLFGGSALSGDGSSGGCLSPLSYPELQSEGDYGVRFHEQYAPQQVNAPEAWDELNGYCGTDYTPSIAVIDTGVAEHPHVEAQVNRDAGYDFARNSEDATPGESPIHFHGTHVAGIASGNIGTDSEIYPVSDAEIIPVKVFGGRGGTTAHIVADGIQHAAEQGADVANLSLGAPFPNQTIRRAIENAVEAGTLPVAAAGNAGRVGVGFPAGFGKCMAVGALNGEENIAQFSNRGQAVNVTGPGVEVLSSFPEKFVDLIPGDDPYFRVSGTSMSTPAVAGVAALGKQVNPDLSPTELKNYVEATARPVSNLPVRQQGSGVADAAALIRDVRK